MPDAVDRFLETPDEAVPAADLLPRTNEALSRPMGAVSKPATLGQAILSAPTRQRAAFMEQNVEGTTPLDVESGLSRWERLMYEIRGSKEAEIEALQTKYGKDAVRLSTTGVPIVRVMDEGKPKDILVDENKMTARDFIAVAGVIPELAGAVGGFFLGRKLPGLGKKGGLMGFGRDVASETAGAFAAGAAEDVAIETVDPSGRVDIGRTAGERGKQAVVDAAMGTAGVGAMKFFKLIQNPFGRGKQLQFDALTAREYLKRKYGVDVPLTTGEASGNPYLAAQESFLSQQPTGARVKAIKETQNQKILELQAKMVGATADEESIGREAIATIQGSIEPTKQAYRTAKESAQQTGEANVALTTAAATSPFAAPPLDELGKTVRTKVTALRDTAKVESDRLYGVVKSLPGGTGRVLAADDIASDATAMLKKLPSVEKTVQEPTGVLSAGGKEILRDVRGEELLKEWVPPGIVNRLKQMSALKGKDATFSLSDLQQLRRDVYDDIGKGQGVPNLGTHYLSDIGEMLTSAIERETTKVGGGPLKTALETANKHYREKILPFNRIGVSELFRRADEPGFVFDFDVINRVMTNPGQFQVLKETLGDASAEFSSVKRAIADDILARSSLDGQTLNAKSLFDNLKAFDDKYGPISTDVFGPRLKELMRHARDLDVGQAQKIDSDELQQVLKSSGNMRAKLATLYRAQQAKDEVFKNDILKAVASDELNESKLNPAEFVTRFLDAANDTEIKQVLGHLSSNPALLEKIRAKTVENIFAKSSRPIRPEHVATALGGTPAEHAGSVALTEQLKEPKIKTILGPVLSKDMGELAKLIAAPDWVESEFGRSGMFSMGNAIGTLIRKGPLKYMMGTAYKDAVVSWLITSPMLRAWARQIPPNDPGAWQVIFTSPPFMQMVIDQFGEGTGADQFVNSLKSSTDRWFMERQQASTETNDPAMQFLNTP